MGMGERAGKGVCPVLGEQGGGVGNGTEMRSEQG